MKFILLFGPQAVGKMTVGQELTKITDLKLFHNHMTIELVSNFFSYSTPVGKRLVRLFREEIFKEVSTSDLKGLIFTYLWHFDQEADKAYVDKVLKIFRDTGTEIYFVELEAEVEERVSRNKTENRLNHKPTKRDVARSEDELMRGHLKHRANSLEGEITERNYLRINNTDVRPELVAQKIKDTFGL